ncbi:helix-turn-helix transcriptional regulator [Paenibacillus chungangensis]|uniref:AraC family transcriptional regulator n=1 Tax=Paenibacillus chungangensis TaxID=696535 RepID=A0ABW3HUQ8_9BACL
MSIEYQIPEPFTINTTSDYNAQINYHTHFHYEIYYFHSGKANYLINDRIHVLEPGNLVLMHGMTLHKAHVDPSVAYHRTILHFDPYYFQQFIQPSYAPDLLVPFKKLQNVRLHLCAEDRQEIEESFAKLITLYKQPSPVSRQRFQARLLDLIIIIHELCQKPMQEAVTFPSSKEQHVQSIISYVESRYKHDLSLDHIGRELHLSKFYLAKTFKEVTGTTIFQYLMHRRVYQAKLALIESGQSITDIGYEVGFKHPSHFSRAFKAHTGKTPEQYRREHQIPSEPPAGHKSVIE